MANYGNFIEWIDLENNGMLTECAVLKRFEGGDCYFFPISSLDLFDKRRLHGILVGRTAELYDELWKLLEQHTLGNGINALTYFNQLVKHRTASGSILPFGSGKQSMGTRKVAQPAPSVAKNEPIPTTQESPVFDNMVKNNAKK